LQLLLVALLLLSVHPDGLCKQLSASVGVFIELLLPSDAAPDGGVFTGEVLSF
jgi:hypothetical protein